jgi:polyphosphate glucokinase
VHSTTLLGVDVGGTGVKAAPVDLATGTSGARERVLTPHPATPAAVAAAVVQVASAFDVDGPVGCTMPAVVTRGIVRTASNIDHSWIGTDAHAVFGDALSRPVVVVNDADAAGVAEMRFGAARDVTGVVMMVTLGTGVGTALFVDGTLVPNTELGHLEVNGKVADSWASVVNKEAHDLSWKAWAKRVDTFLTHLHALMRPDLIVLGGGIVKHSDKFLDRIDPGCEVRVAALGNNAGIVGAAHVASTLVEPDLVKEI